MKSNPTLVLTLATIKMWSRDRAALFWTFVLPLIIMSIFGVLNFGSFGQVDLGVVDQADNEASRSVLARLGAIDALRISAGKSLVDEREALIDGDLELVLVLPADFGAAGGPSDVKVLFNEGRPREVQLGQTVIRGALNEASFATAGVPALFTLSTESIADRSFSYIDFLLPGIVAMSIMQMGMFSVAFGFIEMKRTGILRRLFATPLRPRTFLIAQVTTRLIISILQTLVLIGVAVLLFDAEIVGSVVGILVLAVLGGAVFLSLGFAVAGWAKNENVAAALANVVAMPMMFLSGVFFGREAMPDALQSVTAYLPLTYLADGMRSISSQGDTLWSQSTNLLGLAVWLALSFAVATRLLRWE